MSRTTHNTVRCWILSIAALTIAPAPARTQQPAPQTPAPASSLGQGVLLDRVIAVVNGDTILESDLDEEKRFEEIQPYRGADDLTRDTIIQRLIDRALILQQAALEPQYTVTDDELNKQIETLRKDIPVCRQDHCETDAGWQKYLANHGFTVEEFSDRWRKRMQLLRFIEVRFRNGITISDQQISDYYTKTMLPEYAKRNVIPPKLESISSRIQEVLLQQQVGSLLEDWLKSLRAEGSVRMITASEASQ
jgi:peptidyl-prolyl cis-trans isomerase SurA